MLVNIQRMTEVWHDLWAGSPTPIREGGIPRRANLVKKAENWKWSSAWRRENRATNWHLTKTNLNLYLCPILCHIGLRQTSNGVDF